MEVTILEAVNPPSSPVVAIHTGSVRRQARLEVNRALQLPHPGAAAREVQVTLFQQLASQVLPLGVDGEQEVTCEIPLPEASGGSSKVKLSVRRSVTKKAALGEDVVGDARAYVEHHKLQSQIQMLIQNVLKAQPADPYRYMVACLRNGGAAPGHAASAQRPAAATPPPPLMSELLRDALPAAMAAPEGEAKTAAPSETAGPLVPRPPQHPPPETPSFRKARSQASASSSAAAPAGEAAAPAASAHGAVRRASSDFMDGILSSPRCSMAACDSVRAGVHERISKGMAPGILERARRSAMEGVVESQKVEVQARYVVRHLYARAAVITSPEYRAAIAHWTVRTLLRSAANLIGDDPEMRRKVFCGEADQERRMSLPQPIVCLNADASGWGRLCSKP